MAFQYYSFDGDNFAPRSLEWPDDTLLEQVVANLGFYENPSSAFGAEHYCEIKIHERKDEAAEDAPVWGDKYLVIVEMGEILQLISVSNFVVLLELFKLLLPLSEAGIQTAQYHLLDQQDKNSSQAGRPRLLK
jgi:hypothetical protein